MQTAIAPSAGRQRLDPGAVSHAVFFRRRICRTGRIALGSWRCGFSITGLADRH